MRTHLIHRPARDIIPPLGGASTFLLSRLILRGSSRCRSLPGPAELGTINQMRCMITANRRARATIAFFTDRNDARGIAQMMRVGLYRPVHVKTLRSQKLRMLLTHRKLLQSKAIAIENDLRGTLRFRKSKSVGAVFGLTCSKYQSGEIDRSGRISRCGDEMMRVMLYLTPSHYDVCY